MANTYTQLYIQIVFSVKGRESLVSKEWKNDLYAYIGGIILNHKSKPLAINGMPDHIHMLIGYNPSTPLPTLVEEIKISSNNGSRSITISRCSAGKKAMGHFPTIEIVSIA